MYINPLTSSYKESVMHDLMDCMFHPGLNPTLSIHTPTANQRRRIQSIFTLFIYIMAFFSLENSLRFAIFAHRKEFFHWILMYLLNTLQFVDLFFFFTGIWSRALIPYIIAKRVNSACAYDYPEFFLCATMYIYILFTKKKSVTVVLCVNISEFGSRRMLSARNHCQRSCMLATNANLST